MLLDVFAFDDVLPLAATAGKTDPDDIPETPKNPVSRVGKSALDAVGRGSACIANGRLRHTVEGAVRRAPPRVVSRV